MERRLIMTGDALLGCAFEHIVHVAFCAFDIGVRTGQLERGFGMVEGGVLPVVGSVAASAIITKRALMGIIFACDRQRIAGVCL